MQRQVCVYCSASDAIDEHFFEAARELGAALAARRYGLVYGGGGVGLMGAVARAVRAGGGSVLGVIPEALRPRERSDEALADRLVVTQTMRERKALMEDEADAFVALPGGFGTCEELLEIITLKQLRYQSKPLIILNVGGYYDLLLAFFEQGTAQGFIHDDGRRLFHVTQQVSEVLDLLEHELAEGSDQPLSPPPHFEEELREAMDGP